MITAFFARTLSFFFTVRMFIIQIIFIDGVALCRIAIYFCWRRHVIVNPDCTDGSKQLQHAMTSRLIIMFMFDTLYNFLWGIYLTSSTYALFCMFLFWVWTFNTVRVGADYLPFLTGAWVVFPSGCKALFYGSLRPIIGSKMTTGTLVFVSGCISLFPRDCTNDQKKKSSL